MNISGLNKNSYVSNQKNNKILFNDNFKKKFENLINDTPSRKDNYFHTSVSTSPEVSPLYTVKNNSLLTSNQLPLETSNYEIKKADSSYLSDFIIINKKNGDITAINESDLKIQKDENTGLKLIFNNNPLVIDPKIVVDDELETTLTKWFNSNNKELLTTPLTDYDVNINPNTGIKYLTHKGMGSGSGAEILLITDADYSAFEKLTNEYLKHPNIASNSDSAKFHAYLEISCNAVRNEDGIFLVTDLEMSFTSYDKSSGKDFVIRFDKKKSSNQNINETILKIIENSSFSRDMENEKYWNDFLDNLK